MKTWMTVKQVAEYLQLSTMMIYKLAQKGEIPAAKIGSAWRFDRDEVDAWLSAGGGQDSTGKIPPEIRDVIDRFLKNLRESRELFLTDVSRSCPRTTTSSSHDTNSSTSSMSQRRRKSNALFVITWSPTHTPSGERDVDTRYTACTWIALIS